MLLMVLGTWRSRRTLAMLLPLAALGTPTLGVVSTVVFALYVWILKRVANEFFFSVSRAHGAAARTNARHAGGRALDTVTVLTASLSSPNESEALAALDLLVLGGGTIPTLVLYHPSPAVVLRALGAMCNPARPKIARVLTQLANHRDPRIREVALCRLSQPRGLLTAS